MLLKIPRLKGRDLEASAPCLEGWASSESAGSPRNRQAFQEALRAGRLSRRKGSTGMNFAQGPENLRNVTYTARSIYKVKEQSSPSRLVAQDCKDH